MLALQGWPITENMPIACSAANLRSTMLYQQRKPSQNPHSHSGQCLTDQSTLCYNSLTGQGQLLWLGVCLHRSFGRRFNLVSMVDIPSEYGSTGLTRSMQAKRLNVRKASKYAGFQ